MKIMFTKFIAAVLAAWFCAGIGTAATLTVSPAVTSNTYSGVITLNIGGLTNTEQVIAQKWLDGNANGSIDAGEPLMDVFKIADGGAMVIGGVTNISVPFDSNPATGAVTTALNFGGAMALENIVGRQIYQVVSPTGRFAPVTATLVVTNAALSQSVSGIVYSNGVTPFPYAVVVAQDQQANNPAGAAVADATGHYLLKLNPGSYSLIAGFPNYYFNQNLAPSVTLTNGMSATNDLSLTNGTVAISGSIYDSASSNGVGGLLLQFNQGGLFAIAFTDTNGNYAAAVTPSFWKIKPSKERLARRAYVVSEAVFQVNTTGGNVTNANLAVFKGNALFYGRITDNSNAPFANVRIDAGGGNNSGNSFFDAKGFSDANGYFAVAVLGDLTNYWSCNANDSKNTVLAHYIVSTTFSVTNSPGQTTLQNFVALPATATISGHVQSNSGTNVGGVGMEANAFISGNNYQAQQSTTDTSGNYSFAVAAGQWNVYFLNGGFQDNLDTLGYVDLSAPHTVNIPPTNVVLNLTVFPLGTPAITSPQRFSATQFGFTISGATNVNYTVQSSTNLASTNWSSLFSFQMTTNPFPVVDSSATNSPRFYRVRKN